MRMMMIQIASVRSRLGFFLTKRISSRKNGTKKWKIAMVQRDVAPAAAEAANVPGDFVRQISGPDDQELRERHVGPQHGEGQHQIAEVVIMLARQEAGERLAFDSSTSTATRNAKVSSTSPTVNIQP